MHYVTTFSPSDLTIPSGHRDRSDGYQRVSHIDRQIGAIHTGLGTCELRAGGQLGLHVHSYEEFVYVLEGRPCLTVSGRTFELAPDEGAFIGVGEPHAWHNPSEDTARWIDLQSPQARSVTEPPDTFFLGAAERQEPESIDLRDPLQRRFTRWHPSQMDLDALKTTMPIDAPAVSGSMASALLAYSGITVKMLLDERHGAYLGNMFMVDYYPGVILTPHDHTIEEAFYMLEGEVVYIADRKEYTLRPGDTAYAGVGCIHAFENRTKVRCRWLETRAPLPPTQHAYRFERDWAALRERGGPVG